MSIKGYIVSVEEIYGVLCLSMEFYLCLWNSIFVYGVLSLSMEFYFCLWSSIFVYGVLSLYAVVGCMYMETFGCMYAVVGCKYMETFGCMYMRFGCISDTADSLPDNR